MNYIKSNVINVIISLHLKSSDQKVSENNKGEVIKFIKLLKEWFVILIPSITDQKQGIKCSISCHFTEEEAINVYDKLKIELNMKEIYNDKK